MADEPPINDLPATSACKQATEACFTQRAVHCTLRESHNDSFTTDNAAFRRQNRDRNQQEPGNMDNEEQDESARGRPAHRASASLSSPFIAQPLSNELLDSMGLGLNTRATSRSLPRNDEQDEQDLDARQATRVDFTEFGFLLEGTES
ncbi:hypothetical protein Q7P36_007745 [Cladosporium allicinum]